MKKFTSVGLMLISSPFPARLFLQIMKNIENTIDRIPGLGALVEKLTNSINGAFEVMAGREGDF